MTLQHRDTRASDLDREQAVAFLRAHYADGRLEAHELEWRSDAAYRAVGLRELDQLCADLPALPVPVVRRRGERALGIALLIAALAVLLVVVPPELTIALVAVLCVLAMAGVVLLAPLWIPVALGVIVYRLVRTARRPPAAPRVGWR